MLAIGMIMVCIHRLKIYSANELGVSTLKIIRAGTEQIVSPSESLVIFFDEGHMRR